jgi:hypothetical protein
MSQEIVKAIADHTMRVSVTGGLGSSFMAYLNVNAAALGLLISLAGVLIATLFYWLNYRRAGINMIKENDRVRDRNRIIELESQVRDIDLARKNGRRA